MALKKFLKGAIADAIDRASSTIQGSLNEISSNLRDDDGQNLADLTDDNNFNIVKTVVIGENYDSNYEVYTCVDEAGVNYSEDGKILVDGKKDIDSYSVKAQTEILGLCAFMRSSIKNIELPSSLLKIDRNAFSYCKSLDSIKIPESVEQIGSKAFAGCISLESVTIESDNVTIEDNAFDGCSSLKQIIVPSGAISEFKDQLPPELHLFLIEDEML